MKYKLICGLKTIKRGTLEQIREYVHEHNVNVNACTLVDRDGRAWMGSEIYSKEG